MRPGRTCIFSSVMHTHASLLNASPGWAESKGGEASSLIGAWCHGTNTGSIIHTWVMWVRLLNFSASVSSSTIKMGLKILFLPVREEQEVRILGGWGPLPSLSGEAGRKGSEMVLRGTWKAVLCLGWGCQESVTSGQVDEHWAPENSSF